MRNHSRLFQVLGENGKPDEDMAKNLITALHREPKLCGHLKVFKDDVHRSVVDLPYKKWPCCMRLFSLDDVNLRL